MKINSHRRRHLLLLSFFVILNHLSAFDHGFLFNGFREANLSHDGAAVITPEGLLQLTNATAQVTGHTFYPIPIPFKNFTSGNSFSFSTTYVFAIRSALDQISGNGIAFAIAPGLNFSNATGSQYLGLFNSNNGSSTNRLFSVELDTIYNPDIYDIDDNHVGIDINSIISNKSLTAGYYPNGGGGQFKNLTLTSGDPMQVWIDYNDVNLQLDVTIAPINSSKPYRPLLSSATNLSGAVKDYMYVGFSSSTGSFLASHYILGWSFMLNGKAQDLNISGLPELPPRPTNKGKRNLLVLWVSLAVAGFLLLMLPTMGFLVIRKLKFKDLFEDWEKEYESHRFSYIDLYRATGGFEKRHLLGVGGFGRVYRGVLPGSKREVAVKRIPRDPTQDIKHFIAETVGISNLRHRNVVQQVGYCRRPGEILLVYDFMPNGSLDKLLFCNPQGSLQWRQRVHIVKGVASGLYYLHEEWEKVVIHRDVKASNVMLDGDFNARLGDFGLARLYDQGSIPKTTHVVGTIGYLAPELARTGRATKATDVFAYGVFVLEVVCGRRPIEAEMEGERMVLVDWVLANWRRGTILEVVDPKMAGSDGRGGGLVVEEVDMIVKLGLLCSHPLHTSRPSMREVVEILDGVSPMPEISTGFLTDQHGEDLVEEHVWSSSYPLLPGSGLWADR